MTSVLSSVSSREAPVVGLSYPITVEFTRPANTTAYAARDRVTDGDAAVEEFANAVRAIGDGARIVGATLDVTVIDSTVVQPDYMLLVHKGTSGVSTMTDNLSIDGSVGSNQNDAFVGPIHFRASSMLVHKLHATVGAVRYTAYFDCALPWVADDGSTSLSTLLFTMDAFTPLASQQYRITLEIEPASYS